MATQTHETGRPASRSWVGGAVLVAVGLLLFLQQVVPVDLAWLLLPGMALALLAAGVVARKAGLLIPGSILGGLSVGIALMLYPFRALAEPVQGGIFLLVLAAGFAFITPLTAVVTRRAHWWALVVAGVLAAVSGLVFAGDAGQHLLALAGMFSPLLLVVIGVAIILRRK